MHVKLLPLTDSNAANAEFRTIRKVYLDTLPSHLNLSTPNSENFQTIPKTAVQDHPGG